MQFCSSVPVHLATRYCIPAIIQIMSPERLLGHLGIPPVSIEFSPDPLVPRETLGEVHTLETLKSLAVL